MFTSLQTAFEGAATGNELIKHSGTHGFWMSLVHFSVLASLFIGRLLVDIYLTQRFMIAWRMWLTGHLTDDWLRGRAYYRDLFIDNTIDNPDQRIQQDVDIFTAGAGGTPEHPVQRNCEHVAVRRGACGGFGGVVCRHPVGSVRAAGHLRLPAPPRDVLDCRGLRGGRDGRRVPARASADLAQLQQRETQRRIPLCPGPVARCGRGGRLLPR